MVKKTLLTMLILFAWEGLLVLGVIALSRAMEGRTVPPVVSGALWVAAIMLFVAPIVAQPLLAGYTPGWFKALQANGTPAPAEVLANDFKRGNWSYSGPDMLVDVRVRVEPAGEPNFEAKMKCRLSQAMYIKPGQRLNVRYDPQTRRVALPAGMEQLFSLARQ